MKKECKYCGEIIEYEKFQQLAGHAVNCKKNPRREEIIKRRQERVLNNVKREYTFNCITCGKEYKLELLLRDFKNKEYRKNCSYKCANSKLHKVEDKLKTSLTFLNKELTKRKNKVKIENNHLVYLNVCKECKKEFWYKATYKLYCSKKCLNLGKNCIEVREEQSKRKSEFYKLHPEKHPNRTCAGIKESFPEKMFREFLEQNNLKRDKDFILQYKVDKYYVDFYFPKLNLGVEIDGEQWHDLTSEREINREKIIKQKILLKRFWAREITNKSKEVEIKEICNNCR